MNTNNNENDNENTQELCHYMGVRQGYLGNQPTFTVTYEQILVGYIVFFTFLCILMNLLYKNDVCNYLYVRNIKHLPCFFTNRIVAYYSYGLTK